MTVKLVWLTQKFPIIFPRKRQQMPIPTRIRTEHNPCIGLILDTNKKILLKLFMHAVL